MAPARTPPATVARLNAAVNAALADEEVKSRLAGMGARPTPGDVAAYARYLDAEIALWGRVVKESGAQED